MEKNNIFCKIFKIIQAFTDLGYGLYQIREDEEGTFLYFSFEECEKIFTERTKYIRINGQNGEFLFERPSANEKIEGKSLMEFFDIFPREKSFILDDHNEDFFTYITEQDHAKSN